MFKINDIELTMSDLYFFHVKLRQSALFAIRIFFFVQTYDMLLSVVSCLQIISAHSPFQIKPVV